MPMMNMALLSCVPSVRAQPFEVEKDELREALGHRFQLFEPLDVFLQRLATGAGPGGADGVGGGDQDGVNMTDRNVVVVARDRMQHVGVRFAVTLGQLGANLWVTAFHLMVSRLADVMQ